MQDNSHASNFFNEEELMRYSRQLSLPQMGIAGQQQLKQAKVLCIGAGGLGSSMLPYLVAAGVGTIGIIDHDKIELSNLHRQLLYTCNDIGASKVEIAKARLQAINSETKIISFDQLISQKNILEIIDQYDLIADGSDNFATRYLVNDACFSARKPNFYASVLQFAGQCSVFMPGEGPCYRCLFPQPPSASLSPNCAEAGVLGIVPGIMGLLQATEIIKHIVGMGDSLQGRLLTFDALAMKFQEFKIVANPECVVCQYKAPFGSLSYDFSMPCDSTQPVTIQDEEITPQQLQHLLQTDNNLLLLDVREPFEREICHLEGLFIPLAQLPDKINTLDANKLIVVYCRSGGRGRKGMEILRKSGFSRAVNLAGGLRAWVKEIDSSMPMY